MDYIIKPNKWKILFVIFFMVIYIFIWQLFSYDLMYLRLCKDQNQWRKVPLTGQQVCSQNEYRLALSSIFIYNIFIPSLVLYIIIGTLQSINKRNKGKRISKKTNK